MPHSSDKEESSNHKMCIWRNRNEQCRYYVIGSNPTRKCLFTEIIFVLGRHLLSMSVGEFMHCNRFSDISSVDNRLRQVCPLIGAYQGHYRSPALCSSHRIRYKSMATNSLIQLISKHSWSFLIIVFVRGCIWGLNSFLVIQNANSWLGSTILSRYMPNNCCIYR